MTFQIPFKLPCLVLTLKRDANHKFPWMIFTRVGRAPGIVRSYAFFHVGSATNINSILETYRSNDINVVVHKKNDFDLSYDLVPSPFSVEPRTLPGLCRFS